MKWFGCVPVVSNFRSEAFEGLFSFGGSDEQGCVRISRYVQDYMLDLVGGDRETIVTIWWIVLRNPLAFGSSE
jgi:hypothetical protein